LSYGRSIEKSQKAIRKKQTNRKYKPSISPISLFRILKLLFICHLSTEI